MKGKESIKGRAGESMAAFDLTKLKKDLEDKYGKNCITDLDLLRYNSVRVKFICVLCLKKGHVPFVNTATYLQLCAIP